MKKVMLFVGTRKGGYVFSSDEKRQDWSRSNLMFKAWNVMHMKLDPRDNRLHAAVVHDAFGPSNHYSDDFGTTWHQAEVSPAFDQPSSTGRPIGTPDEARDPEDALEKPEKVLKTWHIEPGTTHEPNVLYAGVEPATLFKSTDRGETWEINQALYHHPHRSVWFPGAGGLCLHTIIPHPTDPNQMWIAISTGGCYYTDDGGKSWTPRNKNVRADFLANNLPEFGQCAHKIVAHPTNPDRLYQQNHCGMYRSDNGGLDWIDIGEGKLPSRFGFPIAVHPHDPDTIYIIPEESDQYRMSIEGQFAVWRSSNRGKSWERITKGLPDNADLLVLREAMATDTCESAGVYAGTSTGQIFHTRDHGDSWNMLTDFLPRILSVETAVVEI